MLRLPQLLAAWIRLVLTAVRTHPSGLTLDRLRSDLSHETSSKLARLSGLAREWSQGRLRPEDPATVAALARDLENIHLRHARLLASRFGWSMRAAALLARLRPLAAGGRSYSAASANAVEASAQLALAVDETRSAARALVEGVSASHGVRLGDLLLAAAGEVTHEYEGRVEGSLEFVFEGEPRSLGVWVPRGDGEAWSDLFRNLLRNAAQATLDRWAAADTLTAALPVVVVRATPARELPAAVVEVLDEGVGMTLGQVAGMWRAGQSSHGEHRGQGLTEGKESFIAARARLEVRSVPNVGTSVRLELPPRDVPVRVPRVWQLRPVAWPMAAALLVIATTTPLWIRGRTVSATIEDHRVVVGRDARGNRTWRRDMGDRVEPNSWGRLIQMSHQPGDDVQPLRLPGRIRGECDIVVCTLSDSGTAWLRRLQPGGREAWSRELHWTAPDTSDDVDTRMTRCVFQLPTAWGADTLGAIALNVRNRDDSPTEIQFFSPAGDSLGAYHHPGHLEPVATLDLDGDGRREFLMNGVNNVVRRDTAFTPVPIHDSVYVDCLVLLRSPEVNGQAFPYRRWSAVPPAREHAYLLFPPLRANVRPEITRVVPGRRAGDGRARLAVSLADGRIYHLDGRLRPLRCEIGDRTPASRLADPRPITRALYIHDGVIEHLDIPVGGGRR